MASKHYITFNFNSLPDKAIVKEVEIDCSNASVIGGKGAILERALQLQVLVVKHIQLVGEKEM